MKELNKTTALIFFLILVIVSLFFLSGCQTTEVHGTVIGKAYTPSTTGVGPVVGGKGGVVVTTTPEKWVLILKYDGGSVDSDEVYAETWAQFEKGDRFQGIMHWYGLTDIQKEGK